MQKYEDVSLIDDTDSAIYDEFEMYYPEAEKAQEHCPYLTIDYDQFKRKITRKFEHEGVNYLVSDNWNY